MRRYPWGIFGASGLPRFGWPALLGLAVTWVCDGCCGAPDADGVPLAPSAGGASPLAAAHQPGDGGHQLFGALLGLTAGVTADDAVRGVAVKEPEGHLVERGLHGTDLGEDVDAVAVVIDHLLYAPDLALDAMQALLELVFGRGIPARRCGLGGHAAMVPLPRIPALRVQAHQTCGKVQMLGYPGGVPWWV